MNSPAFSFKQIKNIYYMTSSMNADENTVPKSLKSKPYKKVRLKTKTIKLNSRYFMSSVYLTVILCISFSVDFVVCNRPPKFVIEGQSEIVLRLREGSETPIGSIIYKLKGYDPDGDQLTFGVRHSVDSEIFRIENTPNNEANIYLNKELDRETKDEYYIILTLTDNRLGEGNFVTQSLLLLVEDINDNEPIFKPYKSALEVPENSGPGIITTVEATDRDEGAYGQVVYYLQELEGDNDVFSIGTQHGKGVIRLVKDLDYERKSLYQVRVLAIDRANQGPINTGTADILVKVKDIEDQSPVFSTVTPVTRVSEDLRVGSPVVQLKAHDGDRGINNPIKYSIDKGANGLFAINENTGLIYSIKTLDREDPKNQENGAYILEVTATEQNSKIKPAPSVTTEITIILTDVNDEKPTFRSKFYEAEISENAQENTPLTFIGETRNDVFDYDQGNNGTFELFMEPQNQIFDITPKRAINEATFLIRLKNNNALDYEAISEMNYTLIARELVANGKWSSAPLRIYIRDSNDNFPEFSEAIYNFSVLENSPVSTIIGTIHATDKDSGNFGKEGIRYTGLSGSIAQLLHLNAITGVISIQSLGEFEFDRETTSSHYLTAEVRDDLGYGNRNTVQIIINIRDINDNAPIFLEKQYEAKLFENSMTFDLPLIVKAKDADLQGTRNSDIIYSIIEGEYKNNFTIHKKTGYIKPLQSLNFEALQLKENSVSSIQPVNLTVLAKDLGVPSLSTKVSVIIYLHDVNDHAPEFQRKYYEVAIPENVPSGSFVLQVTSIDRDASSPNNVIAYRIQNGASDKFVISSDTGAISIAAGASLDPDLTSPKTTEYSLSVLALDGGLGDQQLMSSTIVNITILDVNNKSPSLIEPGKITFNENTPVGTFVYKLLAHDLDANPVLRFYLDANISEARSEEGILIKPTDYDFANAFQINSESGVIKVMKLIDRERVEQIKLGIVVEDIASETGKQFDSTYMTIIIEDVNDNNPKFRKPYYKRSITENSPNGVAILNVAAYDIDKNRTINYALEGPANIIQLVQIDTESGEIVVANKIDHELFQWLNYTVRATDSGVPQRSSLVDVFIRVIDENDNNPIFTGESSNLTVKENSPIGTRISMIQAKDADSGDFGKITYLIDKMSSLGKFLIDADTGVLMVADEIDREEKSSYMIVVEAWDNYQFGYLSGESRNAFKQFFVQILDENDSPPVLHLPKNVIQISEYHDISEVVVHVKATDNDDSTTLNGQIEMSISGGNGMDYFKLVQKDSYSADIYAKRSLQNYYGNYSIQITGRDLGTPQNSVQDEINIFILDFNDHAPVFTTPTNNITIRVPENETIGTQIIQVRATDNDVGANAAVLYRLKQDLMGSYRSFDIDQKTGIVTLKKALDRERQKIYEIRVEAYDQGIPPLSSDLDINIYVRNVNDYEPQFLVEEIIVNFTEHKTPGVEKIKLPDTVDRDEVDDLDDPPSVVCYFIVFGNSENIFHLEPESHVLTIRKELDREIKANHTLIVKASEDCSKVPANITLPMNLDHVSYHSALTRAQNNSFKFDLFNRYKHSRSLRNIEENPSKIIKNIDEEPYFQSLVSGALNEDGTLVQVIIYVDDINDNSPEFVTNVFTGGVTTAADFGTKIINVLAIDKDYGYNAQVNYYRIGDIHQTLTEGLDQLSKPPFLVDNDSGAVILNFDPQKGMKGYFDFMVLANDTDGLQDIAHVFIYLLREDQRVRFVLRQQPPQIRDRLDMFRETLSNVTDAIVNVDDFKIHENRDGSVDKTKTDLYLHLVNKRDNSIVEVPDVLRLIDQNVEKLDFLFKEFNVLDTQPSEITIWNGGITTGHTILWLIFTNLFITTLLVVVLSLCYSQRKTFKRQLRAARVIAYGTSDLTHRGATTKVPNTNKHSSEGSNPMWLKAYANEWYRNEEDLDPPPSQVNNNGPDSLDENVLANEGYMDSPDVKEFNGFITQNNLSPLNVYHQIEKLTNNAQILTRKLETTEL